MNKIKMLNGNEVAYVDLKEFFRVKRHRSEKMYDFDILENARKKYCLLIEEYGYPFTNYLYVHMSQFDLFIQEFIDTENPGVYTIKGSKKVRNKLFNFDQIVKDENVFWSDDRIKKYAPISNKICSDFWVILLNRPEININKNLFLEIEEWISFKALSSFENFDWDINFIKKYNEKLCFKLLSGNPKLPWSRELILEYKEKWRWGKENNIFNSRLWHKSFYENKNNSDTLDTNINFPCISNNPSIFWTIDLFEEFYDKIDIWMFVANANFFPEIIIKHSEVFLKTEDISHRHRTGEGTERTYYNVPRAVRYIFNPNFSANKEVINWAKSINLSNIFTEDFEPYYSKTLWDYWQENLI